jgi:hypothetical protein
LAYQIINAAAFSATQRRHQQYLSMKVYGAASAAEAIVESIVRAHVMSGADASA